MRSLILPLLVLSSTATDIVDNHPNYRPSPDRGGPIAAKDPFGPDPLHAFVPDFDVVDPVDFFGLDIIKELGNEPFPLPDDSDKETPENDVALELTDAKEEEEDPNEFHYEDFARLDALFQNGLTEEEEADAKLDQGPRDLLVRDEDDTKDADMDRRSGFRKLSAYSASIGTFGRLDCTPVSWSDCGTNMVSSLSLGAGALTIPCNQCYTFDVQGNVTLGGLDIQGKLLFPVNHKVNIRTPYVIVQGELEIGVDHAEITPDNMSTKFILTGTQNIFFTPTEPPNQNVCPNGGCNLGPKPFLIAGGKVNINAMPESCAPHTPVLRKVRKDPVHNPNDFPKFSPLPPTCPTSGRNYALYDFETTYGNFTGRDGAFVVLEDGTMKVTNRKLYDRGPYIDLTPTFPALCLVPDQEYLFYAR